MKGGWLGDRTTGGGLPRPNVTAIDLRDCEETLDSDAVNTDSADTSRLLSVGREWEWSTDAEDARLDAVWPSPTFADEPCSTAESTLATREPRAVAGGGLPYGERAARVRCLPNVDHGEVVAEGWEPRAARCFAFHADGPGEAAIGAENSLFSFSDASRPCCCASASSLAPSPKERKPERLRARGGLSAPAGVELSSNDPSRAGRSSTIRRSTRRGSEREGERAGGSRGNGGSDGGDTG